MLPQIGMRHPSSLRSSCGSYEHPLRPWLDRRADAVERLCQAQRVRVRVLGGVVGPRVVRFQLAPDSRISGESLERLEGDLSLALMVPSVRLSRSGGMLSLEVPRPEPAGISLVRLQAALSAREIPPVTAVLGRDEAGSPLLLRLPAPEVCHILIAGTTGSGKTALARAILTSLALANEPDDLRLLLIDPKGRGFGPFAGLPHMLAPTIRGQETAQRWLDRLIEEMTWREQARLSRPHVLVAVDEVADLVGQSQAIAEFLTRLAARGRESGIHLLLCTQKPTAEAIGSLLRSNLPCRLVGRVVSAQDAVIATGIKRSGAENLLGRGDFLLVTGGEMHRFQAGYVAAEEIEVMVEMFEQEMRELAGSKGQDCRPPSSSKKAGKLLSSPSRWVQRVVRFVRTWPAK